MAGFRDRIGLSSGPRGGSRSLSPKGRLGRISGFPIAKARRAIAGQKQRTIEVDNSRELRDENRGRHSSEVPTDATDHRVEAERSRAGDKASASVIPPALSSLMLIAS